MEVGSENRILIADWEGESVGLLVDQVADAIQLESGSLEPAPRNLHGVQMQKLRGVFHSGECLVALLDLAAVLGTEERAQKPPTQEQRRAN